jgi:predicted O-methyltransferase YrrM
MLSGHFQGRLLSFLSKMMMPMRILEIGTYTGYSAICLAEGLQEGGKLITIDCNEELEEFVNKTIQSAHMSEKIEFRKGDASEILPGLEGPFDLVFIDADKVNYALYYGMIFSKVRIGGLILADNVLWSGKVIDKKIKSNDEDTPALQAFNDLLAQDERVEKILLPVRDGIFMARKIKHS